ncbi:type I pantothenate kinase [Parapedobacter sp. ISTM3]|uniref:Pantothenate kinase n=1 Tax=Parapedobacter luteus TaxID=623280 RepID=A0A1T5FE25_9SPHI|nr:MULTISPECIES: type I pantothenate kinase [Parapedobacter]MBK1441426.1 type I pantothenate kinase [Parapedobacter sp. ISTM3]SKB94367.1 pantothenate kinase [Parapedobacter luteus]
MVKTDNGITYSPFRHITREEWKDLNGHPSYLIADADIHKLNALNEPLTMQEIEDVYFPLSHLLQIHIDSYRQLHQKANSFFNNYSKRLPFIIGIAGSVAAGKSTTARVLQKVLSLSPGNPKVDLITTDGFLHPNHYLESKGILNRKGFPESYDTRRLLGFLSDIKSGKELVSAPVYSHLAYDILPNELQWIAQPDVLIVEGINVLQVNVKGKHRGPRVFVSDFFDYSIYVDASPEDLLEWYIQRFKWLRKTAFQNPGSYFHRYANLSEEESIKMATQIWNEINKPNLLKNILPTRLRADLILEKGNHHFVKSVKIRKV